MFEAWSMWYIYCMKNSRWYRGIFKKPLANLFLCTLLFVSGVVAVLFPLKHVNSQTSSCYAWNPAAWNYSFNPTYAFNPSHYPGSTQTVSLKLSNGSTQTITIPNQSTPSLLQAVDFQAPDSTCGLWFTTTVGTPTFSQNFQTASVSIPFKGSPITPQFPATAIVTDYATNRYGFLWNVDYHGPTDINSVADEDAIISSVDSAHQFKINTGTTACNAGGWCSEILLYNTTGNMYNYIPGPPQMTIAGAGVRYIPDNTTTYPAGPAIMSTP